MISTRVEVGPTGGLAGSPLALRALVGLFAYVGPGERPSAGLPGAGA